MSFAVNNGSRTVDDAVTQVKSSTMYSCFLCVLKLNCRHSVVAFVGDVLEVNMLLCTWVQPLDLSKDIIVPVSIMLAGTPLEVRMIAARGTVNF